MLAAHYRDSNVCIIGLGYVGLTLGVAMADVGFRVYGVERSHKVLESLSQGRAHFNEIGLNEKLARQIEGGRFTFSDTIDKSAPTNVYIVTVGTPIGRDRRTQFESLRSVISAIAEVLKDGDLVILRSTVRVGTTRSIVAPMLDERGVSYDLAFCPERTLEGKAVEELRTLPQVVGGRDSDSAFRASQVFSFLTPTVVRVNDLETAEMIKLVNNTHRDISFAFANEVACMCDALGISAKEVIASGNVGYPRANLPLPGPVGGPCLEKDPYILAEGLKTCGAVPHLALHGRALNEHLPEWSVGLIAREFRRKAAEAPAKIAVLGVAFKGRPETNDLRGTMAIPVIQQLKREFPKVQMVGWDAAVMPDDIRTLGIDAAPSLEEAFQDADIAVIQNNHMAFERMDIGALSMRMRKPGMIYDYWCQRDQRTISLADRVSYHALGSFSLQHEAH